MYRFGCARMLQFLDQGERLRAQEDFDGVIRMEEHDLSKEV